MTGDVVPGRLLARAPHPVVTVGSEPASGEQQVRPRTPVGPALSHILWLQRHVGNRAVWGVLGRYTEPQPAPTLPAPRAAGSPQFAQAALDNAPLTGAPMRTLQILVGARPSGRFDEATYMKINAQTPPPATPGVVDEPILEVLLTRAVAKGMHTQMARLVDAFAPGPAPLSMRFDAKLATAHRTVREEGLDIVTLGPGAFADIAALRTAMRAAIALPTSVQANATQRLDTGQQLQASMINGMRVRGIRSAHIVNRVIGGADTDPDSANFAEWVAGYQAKTPGLVVNGQVDDPTFATIARRLESMDEFASLIRLVIDRYMLENDWVVDVAYDRGLTRPFSIDRTHAGPVTIDFGPKAFLGNVAGIAHTIADAYRQAAAHGAGQESPSKAVTVREQEMLGKAEQLIARAPQGSLGDDEVEPALAESRAAFRADVADFLAIWRALTTSQRQRNVTTLERVRDGIQARDKELGKATRRQLTAITEEIARVAREK